MGRILRLTILAGAGATLLVIPNARGCPGSDPTQAANVLPPGGED